jgi:hypothetical protein
MSIEDGLRRGMSQKSKCKKIAEAAPEMCTVAYFTPRAQRVHETANRSAPVQGGLVVAPPCSLHRSTCPHQ